MAMMYVVTEKGVVWLRANVVEGYLKATADLLYPAVTAPDMLMAASWPSLNEFLRALLISKTPSKYMRTGTCQNSHASRLLKSFNHDWVWI
jgi:hypothetical protein